MDAAAVVPPMWWVAASSQHLLGRTRWTEIEERCMGEKRGEDGDP